MRKKIFLLFLFILIIFSINFIKQNYIQFKIRKKYICTLKKKDSDFYMSDIKIELNGLYNKHFNFKSKEFIGDIKGDIKIDNKPFTFHAKESKNNEGKVDVIIFFIEDKNNTENKLIGYSFENLKYFYLIDQDENEFIPNQIIAPAHSKKEFNEVFYFLKNKNFKFTNLNKNIVI